MAKRKGKIARTIDSWRCSGSPHLERVADDVDKNMRCNKEGKYHYSFNGTDKKMASKYPTETARAGIKTTA